MSDDITKPTPNEPNWEINLPESSPKTRKSHYPLFHCRSCGVHAMVICETRVKDSDDYLQIRLVNILPNNTEITYLLGDQLPGDVETYDILICGICGKPGFIKDVPEFALIMNGAINPGVENSKNIEEKKADE